MRPLYRQVVGGADFFISWDLTTIVLDRTLLQVIDREPKSSHVGVACPVDASGLCGRTAGMTPPPAQCCLPTVLVLKCSTRFLDAIRLSGW
jgi:hypothetical protein